MTSMSMYIDLLQEKSIYGDRSETQLRRRSLSPSEESILCALWETELYGRQVRDAVRDVSGGVRDMALGTIQPTLAKLERQKLVRSRWAPGTERLQGGKRRLYRLTTAGQQVLLAQREFRDQLRAWKPESERDTTPSEEQTNP